MEPINKDQFRQTLQDAVRQHEIQYTHAYGLAIRWEGDDTAAEQDYVHFQSILSTFQLPAARELVIQKSDKTPGWTVRDQFRQILANAKATDERSLVIVHYAGHGEMDDGVLCLSEGLPSRMFSAERFMISLTLDEEYDLQNTSNVDVLFIFDCCYYYAACRAPTVTKRVVEIIAASADTSPLPNCPPRNTVTGRLADEIRHRQQSGHSFVEFADVVQTLRARQHTVNTPTHGLKMGARSIRLPLSGIVNPYLIQPILRALFSVHISNNISQQEFDQLNRSLPSNSTITLEGIYPLTGSMCIILSSSYTVYSKIANMRGYKLIAETTGPNLLKHH